jgi:hypothetical protein
LISHRHRVAGLAALGGTLTALALAGPAVAAPSADAPSSGTIRSKVRICVHRKTHTARAVRVTEKCRTHEQRLTWKQYQASASGRNNTSGAEGPQGPVGPIGPTGANGANGAKGANGANGATGAKGDKGDTGERGETGANGATGATGPSDIYTTVGSNMTMLVGDQNTATLTLPAGSYLLQGQARVLSLGGTGVYLVHCRIRDRGIDQSSISGASTTDATGSDPDEGNMSITSTLTTTGGVVILRCRGFAPFAFVSDVQLTAIKTGALHIQ